MKKIVFISVASVLWCTSTFAQEEKQTITEPCQLVSGSFSGVKVPLSPDPQARAAVAENGNNPVVSVSGVTVKNLSLDYGLGPEPHVKGVLEVTYSYRSAAGHRESGTRYQWYISDAKDGQYAPLKGIHAKTVILLREYVGKYLRCEVTARDEQGNTATPVRSAPTDTGVLPTQGNPLTDWLHEARFGISHHLIKEAFTAQSGSPVHEQWNPDEQTWSQFVDRFNVSEYARQVNQTGARFVILTLNQNSGYYITPIAAYDRHMRQAGLLGDEPNPMTSRRDLPLEIMDELARYGIKVILYHPSNPPNRAHRNGQDYRVTTDVFHYTPGLNGAPGDTARQLVNEIVTELGARYGEKLPGFWFDGFYREPAAVYNNMDNAFNISDLANAVKTGNPYRIAAWNTGWGNPFCKSTSYSDYSAGEEPNLDSIPAPGRFTDGDCQKMMWGPIGGPEDPAHGWGRSGTAKKTDFIIARTDTLIRLGAVMILDTRVNISGEIDPQQLAQLIEVKKSLALRPAKTVIKAPDRYPQPEIQWRHPYHQTLMVKLFLSEVDAEKGEGRQKKMRDKGESKVVLTFEQALEVIRKMDHLTVGIPKIVYLVGWQYNGHDSKYPAWGEVNPKLKRPQDNTALESMRWLMAEAFKYNTTVSVHINMIDAYDDSPLWDTYIANGIIARNEDGSLRSGEWGWTVSYTQEWKTGYAQKRIDGICEMLPLAKAGTVHIDAFHTWAPFTPDNSPISPYLGYTAQQEMETQQNIFRYWDSKGIDVTSEAMHFLRLSAFEGLQPAAWWFDPPIEEYMTFPASYYCGGNSSQPTGKLFGKSMHGEDLIRKSKDPQQLTGFLHQFCTSTLPWYFLNRLQRMEYTADETSQEVKFANGVVSRLKGEEYTLMQNGRLMQHNNDIFVPALWMKTPAIIAYSQNGYTAQTWELPDDWKAKKADLYRITIDGLQFLQHCTVKNHRITLSLEKGEGIVIVPQRSIQK